MSCSRSSRASPSAICAAKEWSEESRQVRPNWENRRQEPGLYFMICDFVPYDCGKDAEDHPSIWLMTDQLTRLRLVGSSEDFGRALHREASPELLTRWRHVDADLNDSPFGRDCTDTSERDRVGLISDPDSLVKFIGERLDEVAALVPIVDQVLAKTGRR